MLEHKNLYEGEVIEVKKLGDLSNLLSKMMYDKQTQENVYNVIRENYLPKATIYSSNDLSIYYRDEFASALVDEDCYSKFVDTSDLLDVGYELSALSVAMNYNKDTDSFKREIVFSENKFNRENPYPSDIVIKAVARENYGEDKIQDYFDNISDYKKAYEEGSKELNNLFSPERVFKSAFVQSAYFSQSRNSVTLSNKIHVPIYLDDERFVIGVYRVVIYMDNKDFYEGDFTDVKVSSYHISPYSVISYDTKYGVRIFLSYNDRLYLPHNIPSLYTVRNLSIVDGYSDSLFISSEDMLERIRESDLYSKFTNLIKDRLLISNMSDVDDFYLDFIKNNPDYIFKNYNTINLLPTLNMLANNTSSKGISLNENNVLNFLDFEIKDLINNAKDILSDEYTLFTKLTNSDLDGDESWVICGNCEVLSKVDDDAANAQNREDAVFQCSCGEIMLMDGYFELGSSYASFKYNNRSYDKMGIFLHRRIDPSEIQDGSMTGFEDFVEGGYKGKFDFSQQSTIGGIRPFKDLLFVTDEIKVGEDVLPVQVFLEFGYKLRFDRLNINTKRKSFVCTKIIISVDRNKYFVAEMEYSDKIALKKVLPSNMDYYSYENLFCLNRDRTEEVYRKYDKYNVIDHYADVMDIEKKSKEYYGSMAFLEGVFPSYMYSYPTIEALIKSNLSYIAKSIFINTEPKRELNKVFDFKETRPNRICKLNRFDISSDQYKELTFLDIKTLGHLSTLSEKTGLDIGKVSRHTMDMFNIWKDDIDSLYFAITQVATIVEELDLNNLNVVKAIEYAGRAYDNQAILQVDFKDLWRDYVYMAIRLGYDLSDDDVLYPSSLLRDHNVASRDLNSADSEYMKNSFIDVVSSKDYKSLEYESEEIGFGIYAPKEIDDIIKEGVDLSHCVGSYVRRIIDNSTKIYFLRSVDAKDMSYYTIEVMNGVVTQIRGKHNSSLSNPRGIEFIKNWIDKKDLEITVVLDR